MNVHPDCGFKRMQGRLLERAPEDSKCAKSAPEAPDSELMQGMLFADCLEYIGQGRIICKFEPIHDEAMQRYGELLQG